MKKILKVTIVLITLISIIFSMNYSYAKASDLINVDGIEKPKPVTTGAISTMATILNIIKYVGIVVSVVALMYIGVRTIIGSAEQKSHYKEALPGYIAGAILILGMTIIPSAIYQIVQGL